MQRNAIWEDIGIPLPLAKLIAHYTYGNMQSTYIRNNTSPTPDTQIQNFIAASKAPTLSIISEKSSPKKNSREKFFY